jgi:hypothetical protein
VSGVGEEGSLGLEGEWLDADSPTFSHDLGAFSETPPRRKHPFTARPAKPRWKWTSKTDLLKVGAGLRRWRIRVTE